LKKKELGKLRGSSPDLSQKTKRTNQSLLNFLKSGRTREKEDEKQDHKGRLYEKYF